MVFIGFFFKNHFYWKLFSDCCDLFDYPGSIVYLSCFTSICQLGGGKVKLVNIKPFVDNCGQKLLNWQFEIVFFSLKCIQIVKTRKWWYENTSKKAKGKY